MAEIHQSDGRVGGRSPGRGRGEVPTPGRKANPPSVTHPLFSFAELAAQGNISNRQVYCLTGDRIKTNHKKTSQAGQLSSEEIGFTHLQLTCPLVLRLHNVFVNSPMICRLVTEYSRLTVPFPGPKAPAHEQHRLRIHWQLFIRVLLTGLWFSKNQGVKEGLQLQLKAQAVGKPHTGFSYFNHMAFKTNLV